MIKVIASDMDGTLVGSNHEISIENIKAIKEAQSKGLTFVIVTGRDYDSVIIELEKYNIKCESILMNGAEYRDINGDIVECININNEKINEILDIIKINNVVCQLYTDDGIYVYNTKEEALHGVAQRIIHFEDVSLEEALEKAKSHRLYNRLKYIEDIEVFLTSDIEIRKIIAFYNDIEIIEKIKKDVSEIPGLAVSSSFYDNIEITNINAQKGLILNKVAVKKNVAKEEVMVLGDSFNDYSMFEEFIESYAMGNAINEIKEIAKYITDTNDNDGVAKAIYKVI